MSPQDFQAHFYEIANAPGGVARLRELIRSLAVYGKLVSQAPSDETVADALAHGTSLDLLAGEAPFEVPRSWSWKKLGVIALVERGGSPRPIKDYLTNDPNGLNWIKIGDTEKGGKYITSAEERIRPEGLSKTRKVYPGDFLLTNSMSFGRPYITKIEGCIHDGWLRIHPPDEVDSDYLYHLLSSSYVYMFFSKAAAGAVVQNLNADKVRELPIPLPPLAEQKRIVAKVEEVMALCDALEAQQQERERRFPGLSRTCHARFAEAPTPANLNRIFDETGAVCPEDLRRSILTLAVQGKLIPQHPDDEPAEICLTRLGLQATFRADETTEALPSSWMRVRFEDVALTAGGVTLGRNLAGRETVSLPYLRVANVKRGEIDTSVIKEVSIATDEVERYALRENDLLMTEGGDWDKVGRAAIWKGQIPVCLHQNHVFRSRFRSNEILPVWFERYFNSPVGRSYFESASKQTTNLASINMRQVRGCPVPFPPLAEQRRIVAKVDELMALVDQLEAQQQERDKLAEAFAKACVAGFAATPKGEGDEG